MFPPSTKMIITSSMSSQEKMKLKPTPLPGQKCHQHPQPCGPALTLALPPAREPRACTPLTPYNCGNTTRTTNMSLFCLQPPEHDQALPWSLDSRIASHSFTSQHSPTELQDHAHTASPRCHGANGPQSNASHQHHVLPSIYYLHGESPRGRPLSCSNVMI